MSDPSKSPAHKNGNDTKKQHKSAKQSRKNRPKSKPSPHEVIDLEQQHTERKVYDPSDLFMGGLAKKCLSFFDWLGNNHSDSFAESLWKNQMILQASQLYPQLNNTQLARLVDRDWKYMPEEERMKICEVYSQLPSDKELEEKIGNCDPQLYY